MLGKLLLVAVFTVVASLAWPDSCNVENVYPSGASNCCIHAELEDMSQGSLGFCGGCQLKFSLSLTRDANTCFYSITGLPGVEIWTPEFTTVLTAECSGAETFDMWVAGTNCVFFSITFTCGLCL